MRMIADTLSDKLIRRLEEENQLPLQELTYDVVVDDPDMSQRYEIVSVRACSPLAASLAAYREAMRREGFRCVRHHAAGDEVTVSFASREAAMLYASVHAHGKHPAISKPVAAKPADVKAEA
jgi:hypothetical protein